MVWSNSDEPIKHFESSLNCIDTSLCTEERHKKCVKLKICQRAKPNCERSRFSFANRSYDKFQAISLDKGMINKKIEILKDVEKRVENKLLRYLLECKPFILTLEHAKEGR